MRQVALLPGAIIFSRDLSLLWLRLRIMGPTCACGLKWSCVSPTARMASVAIFGLFLCVYCGCEAVCCRKYQLNRLGGRGPALRSLEKIDTIRCSERRRSFVESNAINPAECSLANQRMSYLAVVYRVLRLRRCGVS